MKNLRIPKLIFYILFMTAILSCSKDDEINQTSELVGVWQRSDVSENFENKFVFQSDNSGYRTWFEGNMPETAISALMTLKWSAIDNHLTIMVGDEEINTTYSINSNGQLILSNLTDLPFNKIE